MILFKNKTHESAIGESEFIKNYDTPDVYYEFGGEEESKRKIMEPIEEIVDKEE